MSARNGEGDRSRIDMLRRIVFPLMLALLMVASPLPLIASGHAAADDPSAGSEVVVGPSDRTATVALPDWDGKTWDWARMANESGFVRVIIASGTGSSSDDLESWIDRSGEDFVQGDRYSVGFSGVSAALRVDSLESLATSCPDVQVYPDFPVKASAAVNIINVGADQIWSRTDSRSQSVTGIGVTVAVIDTGIDYTHPLLAGPYLGGYDFYNDDPDPMDDNGHGTHVAGIVAAGGGIGVAPGSRLLAYKALGADGSGLMSDVISAIQRALDPDNNGDRSDHADVISMSLGGAGEPGDPVSLAVREAVNAGAVVVVAAGNEGPGMGTVASPGIAPEAITVGAVDASGAVADFSSRGTNPNTLIKPEISAPGVDINSTVPYGNAELSSPTGFMILSGTSMATPHVSGAAALLLQLHPGWSPEQVKSALVSGSKDLDESLWTTGAGELWLPGSSDSTVFAEDELVSYGNSGAAMSLITVTNTGPSATFSISPSDFTMLAANGSTITPIWTNRSLSSPSSTTLQSGVPKTMTLTVPSPDAGTPEGYYEGTVLIRSGSVTFSLHFGYVVLSRVNVHVLDMLDREVVDPFGEVWAYSLPDADVAASAKSETRPSPPASFLLPSGSYSVHAVGHQLVYTYSDPYILSGTFQLGKVETKEVYLRMSEAREMVLDLETDAGIPIYAKDYRAYVRHVGGHNLSFHLTGSDYFTVGTDLPALARSRSVFVSDTDATIGISISGYSYSPAMWSFMSRNWNHWFESVSGNSAGFYLESSGDLHYLLAWEFEGVDGSSPLSLAVESGKASVYTTKYDIPGRIDQPWCDWGTRLPQGAESTFYVRRDTQAPINPFFSGMTRKTIVQGVFSELYYPGGLFNGYSEIEYYSADYSHVWHAATASQVYLPDRNFLSSIDGVTETMRVGSGPYYPSLRTENTASSLVIFHPLLRDQAGAKVSGMEVPRMELFVDGGQVGVYQLSEHRARPDAKRIVSLPESGSYVASIDYQPTLEITSDVNIQLGFSVPATDMDPPVMTGLAMSQRFVPGSVVPVRFTATDGASAVTALVSWRASESASWTSLPVTAYGAGDFGVSIQTSSSNSQIDLLMKISDASGNYLQYTASKVALAQVPVTFELSASQTDVDYRNSNVTVVLSGQLKDASGNPLHSVAAAPIELFVGETKVGMILDEYVTSSSHAHDGNIRFDWQLNPYKLFTGPNQDIVVSAQFDLGIYQPVIRTLALHSVPYVNAPPSIALLSPSEGSVVSAGTVVDLSITDTSNVVAEYALDGSSHVSFSSPWDVSTSSWSDGYHSLHVWATDEDMEVSHQVYNFTVDALSPTLTIDRPRNNTQVPIGTILDISASDARLSEVAYSVDGGAMSLIAWPYDVDMSSWAIGTHEVRAQAVDVVGHSAHAYVRFEILDRTVSAYLVSPADGSVVRSNTTIVLEVLGSGTLQCSYSDGGPSQLLDPPYEISTYGWTDGTHVVTVNVTNDLGGWFEFSFSIVIDDTLPSIVLESPANGAIVSPSDRVMLRFEDPNFLMGEWDLWGTHYMTVSPNPLVFLDTVTGEGPITLVVYAEDKAGNRADATFTFTVDSSDPVITVTGLSAIGAIALGGRITIDAEDPLLSVVSLSIDGSAPGPIDVPYVIDTVGSSLGQHTLAVTAADQAGRVSYKNVTYYVDGSVPVIEINAPDHYVPSAQLEVRANATDDLGISSVVLFYTTPSGGLLSVQMIRDGSSYVGSIAASSLWDGITLYANATDAVGHVSKSASVTLQPTASPTDDTPVPPGSPSGPFDWSFLTSLPALLFIAAIVIASIAFVLLRRRRRHDDKPLYFSEDDSQSEFDWADGSQIEGTDPSTPPVLTEDRYPEGAAMAGGIPEPFAADEVQEEPVGEDTQTTPTLLDSIPDVVVEPIESDEQAPEDATDYGELIERELVRGALQRSVYKEDMRLLEVIRELESLKMDMDTILPPKKPLSL